MSRREIPVAPVARKSREPHLISHYVTDERRYHEHRRVLPVEIVYKQAATGESAPMKARGGETKEMPLPALDVSRLSSEVIRRINKQVRVERERLGRL